MYTSFEESIFSCTEGEVYTKKIFSYPVVGSECQKDSKILITKYLKSIKNITI